MKTMRFLSGVALSGLLVSGPVLLLFFSGWTRIGVFLAHALALGWMSAALTLPLHLVATIMYATGRFEDYWSSLFPLIFGLSLLGMSLAQYVSRYSTLDISFAVLAAMAAGFVILKSGLLYAKPLPFLVMLSIFILPSGFWTTLVVGVLFVSIWFFLQGNSVIRKPR